MIYLVVSCFTLLSSFRICCAATAEDWRSRTIYQVFTDRFAVANGAVADPCDPGLGQYCGGTWQGIINKLDYIQNLGFSAVCIIFPARYVQTCLLCLTDRLCIDLDFSSHRSSPTEYPRLLVLPWILATKSF